MFYWPHHPKRGSGALTAQMHIYLLWVPQRIEQNRTLSAVWCCVFLTIALSPFGGHRNGNRHSNEKKKKRILHVHTVAATQSKHSFSTVAAI